MVRSLRLWWLVALVAALGWLGSSSLALAQEAAPAAAAPPIGGLAAVLLSVPGRIIGAAIVVAIVEAFKQWRDRIEPPAPEAAWIKRAAYAVLVSPIGRLSVALMMSLPTAAAAWGAGAALDDVGSLVLSNWLVAMGLNAAIGAVTPKSAAKPTAVLLVLLSLSGCTSALRQAQVTAAHAITVAGAELAPALRALEQAEGDRAIDRAAPGGKAAIAAALADVEARWEPALAAIGVLEASADAWVAALEAGDTGDWSALLGAGCRAIAAAEPLAPAALGPLAGLLHGVCP